MQELYLYEFSVFGIRKPYYYVYVILKQQANSVFAAFCGHANQKGWVSSCQYTPL